MPDVARETRDHPPKRLMGYYDICQTPLFLATNGKRLVHLTYDFTTTNPPHRIFYFNTHSQTYAYWNTHISIPGFHVFASRSTFHSGRVTNAIIKKRTYIQNRERGRRRLSHNKMNDLLKWMQAQPPQLCWVVQQSYSNTSKLSS